MKKRVIFSLLLVMGGCIAAHGQDPYKTDSLQVYFQEVKAATHHNQALWNKNLYGALLLVDPGSRKLWANEPDSAGLLKKEGSIYTGQLPAEVNIANTAVPWSGKRWAMVMLPLPANKADRIQLLAHELFHRVQPAIGFKLNTPDNDHLDKMEGRLYLRLELEALKAALMAQNTQSRKENLKNAFLFRHYRHSLYPAADSTENLLELNEGIAEYTGLMMSGRNKGEIKKHLLQQQQAFLKNPTYVRSFAYQTIPAWGYLLAQENRQWNKQISSQTRLSPYFQKAFGIKLPVNVAEAVKHAANQYGGKQLLAEEKERDLRLQQQLQEYTRRFVEEPHLEIPFENMSISFNPGNLVPLPGKGTVYPNLRVSDAWGILTVEEGALISQDWSSVILDQPNQLAPEKISGKGWSLQLKAGYQVVQDKVSRQYILKKL